MPLAARLILRHRLTCAGHQHTWRRLMLHELESTVKTQGYLHWLILKTAAATKLLVHVQYTAHVLVFQMGLLHDLYIICVSE